MAAEEEGDVVESLCSWGRDWRIMEVLETVSFLGTGMLAFQGPCFRLFA